MTRLTVLSEHDEDLISILVCDPKSGLLFSNLSPMDLRGLVQSANVAKFFHKVDRQQQPAKYRNHINKQEVPLSFAST